MNNRRDTILARLAHDVLPKTSFTAASFDQLAEEVMELHLAMRGKHGDTPAMELIEIAGIAVNMLVMEEQADIDMAFAEWARRHGDNGYEREEVAVGKADA